MYQILTIFLFLALPFTYAQLGSTPTEEGCDCTPACLPTPSCQSGRFLPRDDCPCCQVCEGVKGDVCGTQNSRCASGFACSAEGFCEVKCPPEPDCPNNRFCLDSCNPKKGCVSSDGRNVAPGESIYINSCNQKCHCGQEGGELVCEKTICPPGLFLAGSSSDQRFCIELRNTPNTDQCCVVLACANNLLEEDLISSVVPNHLEEDRAIRALSGRKINFDAVNDGISDDEYQKKLKDLEKTLNGDPNVAEHNVKSPAVVEEIKERSESTTVPAMTKPVTTVPSTTMTEPAMTKPVTTVPSTTPSVVIPAVEQSDITTMSAPTKQTTMEAKVTKEKEDLVSEPVAVTTTGKNDISPVTQNALPEDIATETADILEETVQAILAQEASDMDSVAPTTESDVLLVDIDETLIEDVSLTTVMSDIEEVEVPTMLPLEETVSGMKDGVIMEVAEDGEPLQKISFPSEHPDDDGFREAKHDKDPLKTDLLSAKEEKLLKFSSKSGSIRVFSTTHNSTILALPSAAGGILHYKESNSNADFSRLTIAGGKSKVLVQDLSPVTKYTFKWSSNDGGSSKIEARTQDGCIHRVRSYAVGSTWHEGCLTTCTCHRGGVTDCAPRCILLAGAIQGDECEERPSPSDPECCVEYVCEKGDNSVRDSPLSLADSGSAVRPKLIVTSKSHNSITVAWDDFRNQDPSKSYVTEYREVPKQAISGQIPWMKKVTESGQPPPTMTIAGLKPLTLYEVRVGIFAGSSVDVATDTITVRTDSGCVYGNTSFPIGEFFQGCEERCSCAKDGSVKCTERCTIPYFRKGSFKNDPLCLEESTDGDDCCVLVMCAHGDTRGTEEDYDQCANTVCGANAECVSWPTLSDVSGTNSPQPGSCRCSEGYKGNPNDFALGCVLDPEQSPNSTHCTNLQNEYSPGDVFFDGCSFKCICNHQREIECEPRCEIEAREKVPLTKDSCHFISDPNDECCKIEVCGSTPSESEMNSLHAPSLAFDGCYYKNNTYKKEEEFTFGCDLKCLCMGIGDVSCFPRCPPIKEYVEKVGEICETLVDPTDSCCNISVCDTVVPEVMKEDPVIDISVPLLTPDFMCSNGSSWLEECNRCDCLEGIGICTRKGCSAGYDINGPVCQNGSKWFTPNPCRWCECRNDMPKCASITCPEFLGGVDLLFTGEMERKSEIPVLSPDFLCTEASAWYEECNRCNCFEGRPLCSEKQCFVDLVPEIAPECEPGSKWFSSDPCKWCECENLKANCTPITCPEFLGLDNLILAADPTVNETTYEEDNEIILNDPLVKKKMNDLDNDSSGVVFIDDMMVDENRTDGEEVLVKNESMLTEAEKHLIEAELLMQNSTNAEEAMTMMESEDGAQLTTVEKEIMDQNPLDETTNQTLLERGRTFLEDTDAVERTTATLNEHLEKKARVIFPSESLEIVDISPIDSSSIEMTLRATQGIITTLLSSAKEFITVSYSHDSIMWKNVSIPVNHIEVESMYDLKFFVPNLEAYDAYQFQASYKDIVSPIKKASLASMAFPSGSRGMLDGSKGMCEYKGEFHNPGDHFYDRCDFYCKCTDALEPVCAQIECPTHFGLDILDSGCLEWEDDLEHTAVPPKCCGQIPQCVLHIDQLACSHNGQNFQHLDFIPQEMVGCDQQCQCISGQLQCENLCSPVQASPPFDLPCNPSDARLISTHTFPCCTEWQCRNESDEGVLFPLPWPGPSFTGIPGPPAPPPRGIPDPIVTEVSHNAARISFQIPNDFVGLPGGIFLRYTQNAIHNPNPLEWMSEVIHEDGNPLDHEQWVYEKKNLNAGTNYTMQVVLASHLSRVEITSSNFAVVMPPEATTPLPRLDIDAGLSVSEIRNISAKLSWKQFNEFELQYIDGIRVRLWQGSKKFPVPVEGPMLHREANYMILRDLKPNTTYNVDLFFFPHTGLTTIISNMKNISFTTQPKPKDKYDFNLVINGYKAYGDVAEIEFSGAHEPEGKYINVYRVVYRTGGDDQDSQKFKIPKTKKDGVILLTDLKPGALYEVWLEAYLKNGGKKTSNVIEVKTEPGTLPKPEKSEINEKKELSKTYTYYSAFVIAAILAAIAFLIICIAVLTFIFRRQNHAKASINSSKGDVAAYDNPSYKSSESGSYPMDVMNGMKSNTTNGNSREEA